MIDEHRTQNPPPHTVRVNDRSNQAGAFASQLSPRELAVLERLADGAANRDIANELQITVNTVKFHLASIYRKLGVDNRTEASVAFVRHYEPGAVGRGSAKKGFEDS
jgi:DNA-binding NarL/FixJ family response regulator